MWAMRIWKLLRGAGRDGLVLLYSLRDPEMPGALKLGVVLMALYTLSPFDLLPDLILLFGWADDLALLLVGIPFLIRRMPQGARARAEARVEQLLARFGGRRAEAGRHPRR
jgi:uncharacterized membrane protein YkvA (DUF1232 family)